MSVSEKWLLEKADRKLNVKGMDADVVKITRKVISEMYKKGIYVGVAQAYRTKAEQDAIYAQGRTKPGAIVTNARGGQSNHNYGVAVDLFRYSNDGTEAIFKNDGTFKEIVNTMKKYGMEWGGDWNGFKDTPHFQLYDAVRGKKKPSVSTPKPQTKPSATGVHVVKYGDTLSEIALVYKTTVANLKKWNNLKSDRINEGDKLKTVAPKTTTKAKPYVVKNGDTFSQIALNHKLTVDQLKKLNPNIKNIDNIYVTQKINVK